MGPPPVKFAEVKTILDGAIDAWRRKHGRDPDLTGQHRDPNFGWATNDQLKKATARGFRLIDPNMIGKNPGQGKDTNLVKSLRDPTGVDDNGQMPDRGPFLQAPDIQKIVDWIDGGCKD
jgi:hypothetical protein